MNLFLFMTEAAPEAGATGGNWISSILLPIGLILVFVVMFVLMNRSQKKQEKEAQKMRDELAIGDEITTIGGIIGQIVSIKGETVTISSGKDKTKIRIMKWAIRSVDLKVNGDTSAKKDAPATTTEIEKVEEKK